MTTDEVRDELAAKAGWEFDGNSSKYRWWKFDVLLLPSGKPSGLMGRKWSVHPMPPTLDGANAAVPEGWRWGRYPTSFGWVWFVTRPDRPTVEVPDTGDPVHDLYALALACVRAGEAKS